MSCWLLKSEPDTFSIDDLARRPGQTEMWDGVRNYQARNFIRDGMQPGDEVLFYHSSCAEPGVVGVAEVASAPYPDPTQFQPDHDHYDPTARADAPRWYVVDVRLRRKLEHPVSLVRLREHAAQLPDFPLLNRGNRLSVLPVSQEQRDVILSLSQP